MAKYVLGEEGARKFKQLTNSNLAVSNRTSMSAKYGASVQKPHPFQIQWAQSSGEKDADGNYKGTYIIWLPANAVTVNRTTIEDAHLQLAENYNEHSVEGGGKWYDLAPMLKEYDSPYTSWPKKFSIYLDWFTNVLSFHFTLGSMVTVELSKRLLIAHIDNYRVTQTINSYINLSESNMPFDVVPRYVKSQVTGIEYEQDGFKIVRPEFYFNNEFKTLEESIIPQDSISAMNVFLVSNYDTVLISGETQLSATHEIEYIQDLTAVPESKGAFGSTWKKLYTLNGKTGYIIEDYRNAVVNTNEYGLDNTTISFGDDGNLKGFFHLWDFYNISSDVKAGAGSDCVLLRTGTGKMSALKYLPLDYLKQSLDELSDNLSDDLSNLISVDNRSISFGEDGNLSGILHLNNFHNSNANTATLANSDLVLRSHISRDQYQYELEYMPFSDYKNWLDQFVEMAIAQYNEEHGIGGGGTGGDNDQEQNEQINQLSADLDNINTGGFKYNEKEHTIGNGAIMVGRKAIKVTGITVTDSGYYSLEVYVSGTTVNVKWVQVNPFEMTPTTTTCWLPMFEFDSDLKVNSDYRGATTVPIYD